jgi:hypothetical protein
MRIPALLLLIAGCGSGEEAKEKAAPGDAAEAAPPRVPTAAERADMENAAAALRAYYDAIGRGDYRAAWALREQRPGLGFERFAESFAPYARYRADVGSPSFPVEADGFVWIDAPVQTWGRRTDGETFGSVGRVMVKRPARGGAWKIAP